MSAADPKVTRFAPAFQRLGPDAFAAAAQAIPALVELAAIQQWVCWRGKRKVTAKGEVGWDKVPCLPDGVACDAHDPANWRSLTDCLDGVRGGAVHGVGFVTTAEDPYVLIDFDKIRDPATGDLDEEAARELAALRSYTELSVSQTGVHVIAKLEDPDRELLDGMDGSKRSGVEVYRAKRFFTFTGEHLPNTPDEIVEANDAVQSLWRRRVKPEGHKGVAGAADVGEVELPADLPELDKAKLRALRTNNSKFRASWECKRTEPEFQGSDGPDWSRYDQSLANYAALAGWPDSQIWALLVAFRMQHGADLRKVLERRDYLERFTIAKAQAWAAEQQAKQGAHPGDPGVAEPRAVEVSEQDGRDYSQDGLALSLGDLWRDDARHVAVWGRWLFWDGARWAIDDKLAHMTKVRKFVLGEARELLAKVPDDATEAELGKARTAAKGMRTAATIAAVASLARSNEELVAGTDQWDLDVRLLGTPAGVVDLRTGVVHAAQQEAFITKQTAVAPAPRGTPTPLWDKFLKRIFRHDLELVPYLQRLSGYATTGLTVEQKLFIAHGEGQNGKGVLFNTVFGVLGDYSKAASGDLLLATTALRHPTELASLRGARLVLMSEVPDTAMWNEPLLKRLTGQDRITARFMHQDEFTFDPCFTPVLQVNSLPRFTNPDFALRRRLELIPFSQTIPDEDRDEHLAEKLKAEWPGILGWVIEGAVEYLRAGLRPPQSVQLATEAYLSRADLLSGWLEDCCETGPSARWTSVSELHSHFASWCVGRGGRPISVMAMSTRLVRDKGFEKVVTMKGKGFHIEIIGRAAGHDGD